MRHFTSNHANVLIAAYNRSPYALLKEVYSDYEFLPWLFSKVPSNYFDNAVNQYYYLDWLLKVAELKDQRELRTVHFRKHHGVGLLLKYNNSVAKLLKSLYDWGPQTKHHNSDDVLDMPSYIPRNYWDKMENQRRFMEDVGKKRGHAPNGDLGQWYTLTNKEILSHGGRGLVERYRNSHMELLKAVFPEYDWLPWRFSNTPRKTLASEEILNKAILFTEDSLNIKTPTDWYRISEAELNELGVGRFLLRDGKLVEALKRRYPGSTWDAKFLLAKQSPQNEM